MLYAHFIRLYTQYYLLFAHVLPLCTHVYRVFNFDTRKHFEQVFFSVDSRTQPKNMHSMVTIIQTQRLRWYSYFDYNGYYINKWGMLTFVKNLECVLGMTCTDVLNLGIQPLTFRINQSNVNQTLLVLKNNIHMIYYRYAQEFKLYTPK